MENTSIQERLLESIDTYLYAEAQGTSDKGRFLKDGSFGVVSNLSPAQIKSLSISSKELAASIQNAFSLTHVQTSFQENPKYARSILNREIHLITALKTKFEDKGEKAAAKILGKTVHTLAQGILIAEEKIADATPKNALDSIEGRKAFAELAIPCLDNISDEDRLRLDDARGLFKSILLRQKFSLPNVEGLFRVEKDLAKEGWSLTPTSPASDESDDSDFEIIDEEFLDNTDFAIVDYPKQTLPSITSRDIRNFNNLVSDFFGTYYFQSLRFIKTELEAYRNLDTPIPPQLIAKLALRVEKARSIQTIKDAKTLLIKCGYDPSSASPEEFLALATFVLKNINGNLFFRDEAFTDPNFPLSHQEIESIKDCLRNYEKSQQNPIVAALDDLFDLSLYPKYGETDLTNLLPKRPRGIITEQPRL